VGVELEKEHQEKEATAIAGIHYLLPLMIEADLRLDSEGNARMVLGSELQLTDRTSFEWNVNTDSEYRLQLEYELSKRLLITGGYDDQYDWGVGVEVKY